MVGLVKTFWRAIPTLFGTLLLAGCTGHTRPLMPTPALYTGENAQPAFGQIPAARRSPTLDLLYFTNRAPVSDPNTELAYGSERSKSLAFGSVRVDVGAGLDWDELVVASQSAERRTAVNLKLAETAELGRYPSSPYQMRHTDSGFVRDPAVMAEHRKAEHALERELERRLSETPKKEVVLYVHGFNESFQRAAFTTAELCHFLGREHLCALFTWPAGSGGSLLFSYGQDRESGEFSVAPLKKAIRSIAGASEVEKVHLIAHSRGADVLLQAVRELMLEAYVFGEEPGDVLKLENLVLIAADVDAHVFLQYLTLYASDPEMPSHWQGEALPPLFQVNGRMTIYASDADRALRASTLLYRSQRRLGRIRVDDLTGHMREFLAEADYIDVIQAPSGRVDFLGHQYFTNHPAVSSDLIGLIRYGLGPRDPGRALSAVEPPIIWKIEQHPAERQ